MEKLLRVIVSHLVDNTDEIHIKEKIENDVITLELSVSKDDVGKVIGRQGKIARAIRSVVKAAASYKNKRVIVKIN